MFFFDEEHETRESSLGGGFGSGVGRAFEQGRPNELRNSGYHLARSSSSGSNDSPLSLNRRFHGRESNGGVFFSGGLDDDHDGWGSSSEETEEPSELVPMSIRSTKRNRQRSSTKTGFHDFYKMLDESLGAGAYASVRTCLSVTTGKEYAVKVVDKATASHTRSRIQREVDTFNLCRHHPNIVQLIEWFEDSDNFYMVFEKMNGGPLLDHIQRKKFFTEHEASMVTRDIASALKFLHDRGIAHRDVKPENILCTDRDRVSPVKLCDLDLASKIHIKSEKSKLTQVASEPDLASPVGSAEFMAPEVVDAFVGEALRYDKKCDMWSLGVILYIMLCGYPPFYGDCSTDDCGWDMGEQCEECQNNLFERIQSGFYEFPDEEWGDITDAAKDLIQHLLIKDAKRRYTADEVLCHPWVAGGAPKTELLTPGNLFRNDSARDVHRITEHFNVMRIVAARQSLTTEDDKLRGGPAAAPILNVDTSAESLGLVSQGSPTLPPPNWRENDEDLTTRHALFRLAHNGDVSNPGYLTSNYYAYDLRLNANEVADPMSSFLGSRKASVVMHAVGRPATPESCQSAIAREDSTTEVHAKRREQQVNV